ncbi:MAG TPA: hypothetical protein VM241_09475 [Candidatus Thermoplasmatota archaeon]|nr:hypothetical protein [Candidatus Thermoplasmatota archaeon]
MSASDLPLMTWRSVSSCAQCHAPAASAAGWNGPRSKVEASHSALPGTLTGPSSAVTL